MMDDLDIGKAQREASPPYWPVKVRVSGSCSISVPGLLEQPQQRTFKDAEAEFRVWRDAYGEWQAKALR